MPHFKCWIRKEFTNNHQNYQGEYLGDVGLITDSWGMISLFSSNKNASSILNIEDGAKINFLN